MKLSDVQAHVCTLVLLAALPGRVAFAADIVVPAGGDLQAAINAARAGDTILLVPGATYVGNFHLPVHGGTTHVTIRSAASDAVLPPDGTRMTPAYAGYLPKIQSPNSAPALATRPGAAYWRLMFLEFPSTYRGYYDIITLGDGSGAMTAPSQIPYALILDRLYIHGDRIHGQKRGVALNSGSTTLVNSYISDIKAVEQDSQAAGGWTGPGPFHIENNYMEATGEVFLLGGADPSIPNLVPTNVLIRGNTFTRPLSWRDPVVPTPTGVQVRAETGGGLPAGLYDYRVVALRIVNVNTAYSSASAEVTVAVGAGGRAIVTWPRMPDADAYLVYERDRTGQWQSWMTTTTTFVHDGATGGTAGPPPSSATMWQVKNLLELKNARTVRIERNLLENNWAAAQSGIAVLFTPRNQDGGCPWCVVEDVTFESNLVRNVAGGINILGYDYPNPSGQTRNIRVRNNVFANLGLDWGGAGYFAHLSGGPRDVTFDHNTIIAPRGYGVLAVDGPPVHGFVFTNNLARHHQFGIVGTAAAPGESTIDLFFPGSLVTRNVLAGNESTPYPGGNESATVGNFESHFADYAQGNFALKPGTDWERAGTDGKDLGADFAQIPPTPLRAPAGLRLTRQ